MTEEVENKAPRSGAKGFSLSVLPTREDLDKAIAQNGRCKCKLCWHNVAISAIMLGLDPGGIHKVRVDGGHIKLNYRGWRYKADTPRHVKQTLMLFDDGRYDDVHIRRYNLHFRRDTKIVPMTEERMEQIYKARKKREDEGRGDRRDYQTIHDRVKGMSALV